MPHPMLACRLTQVCQAARERAELESAQRQREAEEQTRAVSSPIAVRKTSETDFISGSLSGSLRGMGQVRRSTTASPRHSQCTETRQQVDPAQGAERQAGATSAQLSPIA